jgi:hypothetical protein
MRISLQHGSLDMKCRLEEGLLNNRLQQSESNRGRYTLGILKVLLPPGRVGGLPFV